MEILDRTIEHIAREQHGAFSIHQARAAGATDAKIKVRLRSGAWRREVRGVYTLAAFRRTWEQRVMCALLSKPDAAVWGLPAAAIHRFESFNRCRPALVLPPGANHVSTIADIHRSAHSESTVVDGMRVTTQRQTVFDLAGAVPFPKLFRAAEAAVLQGTLTVEDLGTRYLELAPLRPSGISEVRAIIEKLGAEGYVPAQTVLEHVLYAVLDSLAVPYVRQAALAWRDPHPMNVDALVPSWGLIVEGDGRRWHTRVADFERDRERDNIAAVHGVHVLRFTHRKLTRDLDGVRALLNGYIKNRRATA